MEGGGATRALAGALLAAVDREVPACSDAHLRVSRGERAGWRFPVRDGALLGRGRGADVALADPSASRTHARLRVSGGRIALEDLGSKNGLTVNGRPAAGRTVDLQHGDRIAIGYTVLIVERDASPRAEARPPAPGPAVEAPPQEAASPRRTRVMVLGAAALFAAAALCAIAVLS